MASDTPPTPTRCSSSSKTRSCRGCADTACSWRIAPWCASRRSARSLDPDKLERLGRYEVHLDRKLERMLAMLIRLKELRRPQAEEG